MASSGYEKKVTVRAVVTCTVEVTVDDSWGGDCPMSQVSKQARVSAERRLKLVGSAAAGFKDDQKVRFVGEPTVKAIIVEEDR